MKKKKERNWQPRILYPGKINPKNKGEIKKFSNIQKLKEFITHGPSLQEILNIRQQENHSRWKFGSTQAIKSNRNGN